MPHSALPLKWQLIHPKTGKVVGSWPHWDYPKWLSWIPRGWTAFKWGLPKQVLGNQKDVKLIPAGYQGKTEAGVEIIIDAWPPKPIGEPGSWQLSRFPDGPWFAWYFACTMKSGWHFRIGARWDDVDNYVQFPTVARRKYKDGDLQDTSVGGGK